MWKICLLVCFLGGVQGIVKDTVYGKVQGQTHFVKNYGKEVHSFLGIPFAKPPVGDLRFRPPQPPSKWNETFKANTMGMACRQDNAGLIWITHPLYRNYSEDCLNLNIFSPAGNGTNYPVMVWFHGGGYTGSGNVMYPGYFLAANDVVVVVPNYRLGALGYMSTQNKVSPGNYGMLDQVLALEFVRDNIANFGGDPNKVTLFGQSAGAASSALHQVSPKSKDLFHQVILQSGTDLAFWAYQEPKEDPVRYSKQLAWKLNCPTDNMQKMVDCLKTKPEEDFDKITLQCSPGYFCQGFAPVKDGENGFLPDDPFVLREQGKYKFVPTMAGQASEDGSLYALGIFPELEKRGYTQDEFEFWLRDVANFITARTPEKGEDFYQAMKMWYTPWPERNDTDKNREAVNYIVTDAAFGVAWDTHMKHNSVGAPTYAYILNYRSTNASDVFPEWMGVFHNADLPYVWGYTMVPDEPSILQESQIFISLLDWTVEDIEYTKYIQKLWTNFAKYGNPTPAPISSPLKNPDTNWLTFSKDNMNTLWMGREVKDLKDYRQRTYSFWNEYIAWMMMEKEYPTTAKPKADPTCPPNSGMTFTAAMTVILMSLLVTFKQMVL